MNGVQLVAVLSFQDMRNVSEHACVCVCVCDHCGVCVPLEKGGK